MQKQRKKNEEKVFLNGKFEMAKSLKTKRKVL